MKKISILLFLFFAHFKVYSQETLNDLLLKLKYECDSSSIFTAFLKSEKIRQFFNSANYAHYFDKATHALTPGTYKTTAFLNKLNDDYTKLKKEQKGMVYVQIKEWCNDSHFLDSLSGLRGIPVEQILYNTASTKGFIQEI